MRTMLTASAAGQFAGAVGGIQASGTIEASGVLTATDPGYSILNQSSIREASSSSTSVFTTLLGAVAGLEMKPLEGNDVCCGFGGTFCVKYPAISNAVVSEKAAAIERSGARLLLGGDLGCLVNMAGKLQRNGSPVRVYHAAEVLAGMADAPAIGEKE